MGTATSRHDGRSTFAEDMERETNDEENKLILITSFSPFVIYEWKKVEKGERRKDFLGPWARERQSFPARARLLKRKLKRNPRMLFGEGLR